MMTSWRGWYNNAGGNNEIRDTTKPGVEYNETDTNKYVGDCNREAGQNAEVFQDDRKVEIKMRKLKR